MITVNLTISNKNFKFIGSTVKSYSIKQLCHSNCDVK